MVNFSTVREYVNTNPRIPSLDGLRGLAIIGVLLAHLGLPRSPYVGWAGVNLFFVLSGFLITGILLRTKVQPAYFQRFYSRRVLRIFPIYYLVLIGLILLYAAQGKPLLSGIWYLTYTQNIPLGLTFESYRQVPFSEWFGHTWSLAVEEQFYLIWPLAVWWLSPPKLLRLCLGMVLVTVLFRIVAGSALGTKLNWFLLFGQMDQLAIGAALAITLSGVLDANTIRTSIASWLLSISAMLVVVILFVDMTSPEGFYSWFEMVCAALSAVVGFSLLRSTHATHTWIGKPMVDPSTLVLVALGALLIVGVYRSGPNYDFRWSDTGQWLLTLMAFFFGVLIYKSLNPASWLYCLLSFAPLTYIGRISYGLYLYHALVYHFVDLHVVSDTVLQSHALKIGVSIIIAGASYRYLEQPILNRKTPPLVPKQSIATVEN